MVLNQGYAVGIASGQGVGASAYAPYPAPSGFMWVFLEDNDGQRLFDNDNQPLVDLMRSAA